MGLCESVQMPKNAEWRTELNAEFLNLELVWKSRIPKGRNYNT